jgi:hypothetical protein
MLASLHNVFDMRMEYTLPFITGKIYALIYVGNENNRVYIRPGLTSLLRSEMDISMNLDCRNL